MITITLFLCYLLFMLGFFGTWLSFSLGFSMVLAFGFSLCTSMRFRIGKVGALVKSVFYFYCYRALPLVRRLRPREPLAPLAPRLPLPLPRVWLLFPNLLRM